MVRTKIYCDCSINKISSVFNILIIKTDDKNREFKISRTKKLKKIENIFIGECLGVLYALYCSDPFSEIYSDSQSVVNAVNLKSFIYPKYSGIISEIRNELLKKKCELKWIRRKYNKSGIQLEKRLNKLKLKRWQRRHGFFKFPRY